MTLYRVLKKFPDPARAILNEIGEELLLICPGLRPASIVANDGHRIKVNFNPETPGVRFRYKRNYTLDITVYGDKLVCNVDHYTGLWNGGGSWSGDLQDPASFQYAVQACKDSIANHLEVLAKHPLKKGRKKR
jgi:hypothetical protein